MSPMPKPIASLLAALLFAVSLLAFSAPAAAEVVNEIVLRINERVLTLYDYLEARAEARAEILRATQLSPEEQERLLAEVPQRVLRSYFQEMLLESRADQLEVFVTAEEIDAEIRRMRSEMGIEDEEQFQAALAQAGLDFDKLRSQVETTLRVQRVIGEEVSSRIDVSEEELRRYYRAHPEEFRDPARVRVREIIVLDTSALDAAGRQLLADQLRARLDAGESLDDLAADYAPQEVTSGVIDVGWVSAGELAPELEQAVWGLSPGEISEPVEARGGIHLLELLEREEAMLRPFSEVREELELEERGRRYTEVFERYLDELVASSHVVEKLPADAVGYRETRDDGPTLNEPFKIVGEEPAPRRRGAATGPPARAADAADATAEPELPLTADEPVAGEALDVEVPEDVPGDELDPLERMTGEDPTPDDPLDDPVTPPL